MLQIFTEPQLIEKNIFLVFIFAYNETYNHSSENVTQIYKLSINVRIINKMIMVHTCENPKHKSGFLVDLKLPLN